MATNKFSLLLIIELFIFTGNIKAQSDNGMISLKEVHVPGTITTGTYSQLTELLGYPKSRFPSTINPISPSCLNEGVSIAPKNKVSCEYLEYDAYEYIRVGDSVQLVFIDLRKATTPIYIDDMVISSQITQKQFLSEITKKGWWPGKQNQYKVGGMDFHYYTYARVKNIGIDYKENPYSSVVFTFYDCLFDKKIWWIEFPIMRIGGIVH